MDNMQNDKKRRSVGGHELNWFKVDKYSPYCKECGDRMRKRNGKWYCGNFDCDVLWRYEK